MRKLPLGAVIALMTFACLAEDGPPNPARSEPEPTCALAPKAPTMRRLTRLEYQNAVRDLLGVAPSATTGLLEDEAPGGFTANTTAFVQNLHIERYADIAQTVAASVTWTDEQLGCTERNNACLERFAERFMRRAYRRPLEQPERDAITTLISTETDFEDSAQTIVEAVLQSPSFLYRPELGLETEASKNRSLSGYELASRLSFLLWASIPDDALLSAAETGRLDTVDGLTAEAERMMASEKFNAALDSFHGQWLKLDKLAITPKAEEYPNWPQIRDAAGEEARRFTRDLVTENQGLSAYFHSNQPQTFVDSALADLYGVPAPSSGFSKVDLDPNQRAGLLTQTAFLAVNAKPRTTSPVHRGAFVREHVLCGVLLPPPANVDTSLPEPPENVTMRAQLEAHRSDPACKFCHELTDPIGFTFEHYDALGSYRTMEAGQPVDATGYIAGSISSDAQFTEALELSAHLARSDEVAQCLGKKWFAFTFARPPSEAESCALQASVNPNTPVSTLLMNFIQSDAFRKIRVTP